MGPDGLPTRSEPDLQEIGVSDPTFEGLANVASVDRFRFDLDFDLSATAELYHPTADATQVMVYNEGHCLSFCPGTRGIIEFFLERGYAVLLNAMPLYGPNQVSPRVTHNALIEQLEANDEPNPLRVFLEAVALSINYIATNHAYERISMMGLSGGGWTTTLYAGIDPRIRLSFPVAGTLPFALREGGDIGDAEQHEERPLYAIANYLDFYLLASAGAQRRQVQILNFQDPCCFAADGREQAIDDYERDIVASLVANAEGGSFVVAIVTDHSGHEVSPAALDLIAEELSEAQ